MPSKQNKQKKKAAKSSPSKSRESARIRKQMKTTKVSPLKVLSLAKRPKKKSTERKIWYAFNHKEFKRSNIYSINDTVHCKKWVRARGAIVKIDKKLRIGEIYLFERLIFYGIDSKTLSYEYKRIKGSKGPYWGQYQVYLETQREKIKKGKIVKHSDGILWNSSVRKSPFDKQYEELQQSISMEIDDDNDDNNDDDDNIEEESDDDDDMFYEEQSSFSPTEDEESDENTENISKPPSTNRFQSKQTLTKLKNDNKEEYKYEDKEGEIKTMTALFDRCSKFEGAQKALTYIAVFKECKKVEKIKWIFVQKAYSDCIKWLSSSKSSKNAQQYQRQYTPTDSPTVSPSKYPPIISTINTISVGNKEDIISQHDGYDHNQHHHNEHHHKLTTNINYKNEKKSDHDEEEEEPDVGDPDYCPICKEIVKLKKNELKELKHKYKKKKIPKGAVIRYHHKKRHPKIHGYPCRYTTKPNNTEPCPHSFLNLYLVSQHHKTQHSRWERKTDQLPEDTICEECAGPTYAGKYCGQYKICCCNKKCGTKRPPNTETDKIRLKDNVYTDNELDDIYPFKTFVYDNKASKYHEQSTKNIGHIDSFKDLSIETSPEINQNNTKTDIDTNNNNNNNGSTAEIDATYFNRNNNKQRLSKQRLPKHTLETSNDYVLCGLCHSYVPVSLYVNHVNQCFANR